MGAALITDPDNVTRNVDVQIDPNLRTITIVNNGTGISANGITGQCLYSYLKEEWKANNTLIKTDFPLVAITPEKFEFVEDWEPVNDTTRKLIRTAGWREIDGNDVIKKEYVGVITLGNIESTGKEITSGHRAYYAFAPVGEVPSSNTTFTFYGPVNEAVLTFDSGGSDYRANTMTTYIRSDPDGVQQGWTFDQTTTVDIGVTAGATLDYGVYRFPLSEAQDLNITLTDAMITSTYAARVSQANVLYYSTNQTGNYTPELTGGPYNFTVLIDATSSVAVGDDTGNLSKNEIYSWVNYKLRQTSNIDGNEGANTKPGYTSDILLQFVGPDLQTLNVTNKDDALSAGSSGVAIINFNTGDINSLYFRDNTGALRNFPFNSSLTINFNSNLTTDGTLGTGAIFTTFYEYTTSNTIAQYNISGVSGSQANFVSTGSAPHFPTPLLVTDAHFLITGPALANNQGVWKVVSITDPQNITATLIDGSSAKAETALTGNFLRNPVDSANAIVVVDTNGIQIANTDLFGHPQIQYLYAYDTNTQGDRNVTVNPQIVFRAIGTTRAQYVEASDSIERTGNKSYNINANLERNYSNP